MSALAAFMPQQTIWSLLRRGGVYVGKNTLRPVVEKLQRSFSTASTPRLRPGRFYGFSGVSPSRLPQRGQYSAQPMRPRYEPQCGQRQS